MIKLLFTALITFSFTAGAADKPNTKYMSKKEQTKKLEEISKDIRREYWVRGYEDVSSSFEFVTKEVLDSNYDNERVENPLDSEEFSQLYKCYHSKSCELYLAHVGASMWGGEGYSHHYILLYPKSKKHHEISHTVSAE